MMGLINYEANGFGSSYSWFMAKQEQYACWSEIVTILLWTYQKSQAECLVALGELAIMAIIVNSKCIQ